MPLEKWAEALALRLQEAAAQFSHTDISRGLNDALNDLYPGQYCYVCDVYGDGNSGDVVYSRGGNLLKAPYSMGMVGGKRAHEIDVDQATNVLPRTVYDEEADEADNMAGMSEAERAEKYVERFPGSAKWIAPFSERFISKAERDSMDSSDFAGKNKSYPIKKRGDVMAAVRSLGRAGSDNYSIATLKSNIKKIAKRKGFHSELPKSWQDESDDKESRRSSSVGELVLRESAEFCEAIPLVEAARSDYEVKLIAPGKGSSAFYPEEVLRRDGPKVFTRGTHMYWNHATDAEESARPEGDLDKLAAVLTSDAYYNESGKAGPGLYARAKVFSDYADKIAEKAPHTGLSIRASGQREADKTRDGRPVLKSFAHAESVDFVTKPGAGGMVLTESARHAESTTEGDEMDAAELREVKSRLARYEARDILREALDGVRLPAAARTRLTERLLDSIPMTDGAVDDKKFRERIDKALKEEADYLAEVSGGVRVIGMGASAGTAELSAKERRRIEERHEDDFKESMNDLAGIFVGDDKALRKAFRKGRVA